MKTINKCIKEWNVIIEALGHGKQTILVRKYRTNKSELLLCPTFTYLTNDSFSTTFKDNYVDFIRENILPLVAKDKMEIKYFITVEKSIECSIEDIEKLDDYYIWTTDHVKSYLKEYTPFVWILRTYKIQKPCVVDRMKGMKYAILNQKFQLTI